MARTGISTKPDVSLDKLAELLPDFRRDLRATNKASLTISSYLLVSQTFLPYLTTNGMPTAAQSVRREDVEAYLADLLEHVSASTAAKHYRTLQQLFRWLTERGDIVLSPMQRMTPPAVPEQPVPILSDHELGQLLDVAKGTTFENRRETAILRLLIDSGMPGIRADRDRPVVQSCHRQPGLGSTAPRSTFARRTRGPRTARSTSRLTWSGSRPGRTCGAPAISTCHSPWVTRT